MKQNSLQTWLTTFASTFLVLLCGVATGVLTARLLHVEGRGALTAVLLWPQLVADVGLFGVHEALTYRLASKESGQAEAIRTSLTLSIIMSGIAVVCGWLLVPTLLGPDRASMYTLARLYAAFVLPVSALTLTLYAVDHGNLRFNRYNVTRLGLPAAYTLGLVSLWVFRSAEVRTMVAVNILANVIALFVAAYSVRAYIRIGFFHFEALRLLKLSWLFNLTAALVAFSSQVDRIIVVKFWDDRSVGLYAVALTLSTTIARALAHAFHTVLFPNIARRVGREQREYIARSLRLIMLLTSLCMVLLMLATPWLIPLAFGGEFAGAINLTIVLILSQVPSTLRQVIIRALRGLGEGRPGSIAEALTGGVFIVICPLAVYCWGLIGIAWALVVANIVSLIYIARYIERRLQLRPREWFGLNVRTMAEALEYGRAAVAKATVA